MNLKVGGRGVKSLIRHFDPNHGYVLEKNKPKKNTKLYEVPANDDYNTPYYDPNDDNTDYAKVDDLFRKSIN